MDEKVEEFIGIFYDHTSLSLWTVATTILFVS